MRLYTRKEFLALPSGVVFAKYEPHYFGEWQIKGNTLGHNDFQRQDFISLNTDLYNEHWEACEDFVEKKIATVDFHDWRRDGLYETDEILFAVLEAHEISGLINRLQEALEEILDEGYK